MLVSGSEAGEEMLAQENPSTPSVQSAEGGEDIVPKEETHQVNDDSGNFCPECYLPLFPDPSPDNLYIYLHALRYTDGPYIEFNHLLTENRSVAAKFEESA